MIQTFPRFKALEDRPMTDAISEGYDMSDGSRFEKELYEARLNFLKKPDEQTENEFKKATQKSNRFWQPPTIDTEMLLKKNREAWSKLLATFCLQGAPELGHFFGEFKRLSPFRDYAFAVLPAPKAGGPFPHGEVMQLATLIEQDGSNWIRIDNKFIAIAIPHSVI